MAQTVDAIELQRPGESHTDIGSVDQASKRNDAYTNDLEAPLTSAEVEDVPPNGGYAWVCCGAVFFINIFTWGPTSAWAIFLAHYLAQSTFPDGTQFSYAIIGGLQISQALIVSPFVNLLVNRLGTRVTMLFGAVLMAVSLVGSSFATRMWHVVLTQGLGLGWGMGFLYLTATAILPQWFSSRRSLANGIAAAGSGIGGLLYNLATQKAVDTVGTAWAYRILALTVLFGNFICALLLKDRNRFVSPQKRMFDYRACGRIEVLLIVAWGILTELGYVTLYFTLPHFAASIGLSAQQGSVAGAMLNLGLGVGRPFVGYYSDRVGRINIAALMTLACGVFCFALWVPASSYGLLITFALLGGAACGTFWATIAPVLADVVGLQKLPPTFGIVCFCLVLPSTFAEPLALQLTVGENYINSQVFVGCVFVVGAASIWALRAWKIFDIERKAASEIGPAYGRFDEKRWLSLKRLFVLKRV